jgi:hypothetical protein
MSGQGSKTFFEDGLQTFKIQLTQEQRDDFQATTFKDLEAAMAVVQERQRTNGTMRSMKKLKGFLDAVQAYSAPLDIFSNVHEVVAFIWVSYVHTASNHWLIGNIGTNETLIAGTCSILLASR